MPLTPRNVALASRVGLALSATASIVSLAAVEPSALPPLLAGGSWIASLLTLLAFPRVRKNDLLTVVGGSCALAGVLIAQPDVGSGLMNAVAGAFGPAIIAATLEVMRVRQLANANWHMPFVEWRQLDRRRRIGDRQNAMRGVKPRQDPAGTEIYIKTL